MDFGQDKTIEVRLNAIRFAARDINLYEFGRPDLACLPAAEPGAHIALNLEKNLVRQYSLVEAEHAPSVYTVAVKREAEGRGGSRFVFDTLKVGDLLTITAPRNNFRLVEDAPHSVFIAGGIGITPIHAMIGRLTALSRSWELHYACRTRAEMPFVDRWVGTPRVHLHFDDEANGTFLDLNGIISSAPPGTHLYCCGPAPMLTAFEEATRDRPPAEVHVEYFTARDTPDLTQEFTVQLARSKRVFVVHPGETILGVLRAAGIDVAFSCEEGICGACETPVLEGIPEHHDSILTEQERAANDTMMICCGGSRSGVLVLDL